MLCCICGIESTSPKCIRCSITSTTNYIKETLAHCKTCDRYLQPPKKWVSCGLDSKELLALIIAKSRYLKTVDVCRASFLPSEAHSKRIKVEIEYKGVLAVGIDRDVNFRKDGRLPINPLDRSVNRIVMVCAVQNRQCADCQNIEAKNYWTCVVQVRQKRGKRNLLAVQNEILENKIAFSFLEETKYGVDFFFVDKISCRTFINFLSTRIGMKMTESERVISQDMRNNTKKSKLTFSIELIPIDQDDFVVINPDFAKSKGVGTSLITLKVGTSIQFVDTHGKPFTISGDAFWNNRDKFEVVKDCRDLQKYVVVDIERQPIANDGRRKDKGTKQTDIYITTDYTKIYHTKTHLGHLLSDGDHVWAYNLSTTNHRSWDNSGFQVFAIRKVLHEISGDKVFEFFSEDQAVKTAKNNGTDVYERTNDVIESLEGVNLGGPI